MGTEVTEVIKRVRCIDNDSLCDGSLTVGKEYDVLKIDSGFYRIKDDTGETLRYFAYRFEDVMESKETTQQKVIKLVRCIDASEYEGKLTTGKVYEVSEPRDNGCYQLTDDLGFVRSSWKSRFEDVMEPMDTNQPKHYSRFKIQPITFISENNLSFWQGNVIKYVCREDAKGGLEDLKKARDYLSKEIAKREGREDWWNA